MRRIHFGKFKEVVLLIVDILDGKAYRVLVNQKLEAQSSRQVTFGTVLNTLLRLEEIVFYIPYLGEAPVERSSCLKHLFTLKPSRNRAMQDIQQLRSQLWPQHLHLPSN